ncbi:iron-containing alcohol dehydrogenase [Oleisolibacter albus]|uniref:iron-containing alcohol dehydrogenase n=1 Tax=Oleisolibacter albus TaxID=2171757 RepID=UPI000DF2133B|nr:iron-containing alcohol dehydrogenase [Oleisolibacter albus]
MIATVLTPRHLEIGGGAVGRLPEIVQRLGITRPLVVTDPWMHDSGTAERVLAPLRAAGMPVELFADTVPDPTTDVVEAGTARLRAGGHDGLVALGGGSPIDTAKAMAILAANGGALRDYKVPNPIPRAGVPLVAIPTTAGTGSEVTRFTVVTDTATDEKMLIAGPVLVPTAAIIDYELTLTCPLRLTADTGIDALTHAIEAYVSRRANPYSDSMALSAMRLIAPHIRRACADPQDRPAREAMMLGATLAGMAFSNASVALVHGMSRPIGAFFHVPHGLSNAMLLPAVTAFSLPAAEGRYADCARALGAAAPDMADGPAGLALLDALHQLNADLAVPSPRRYGIDEGRWSGLLTTMAEQAIASGSPGNNPRVPTAEEIVALYRDAWAA